MLIVRLFSFRFFNPQLIFLKLCRTIIPTSLLSPAMGGPTRRSSSLGCKSTSISPSTLPRFAHLLPARSTTKFLFLQSQWASYKGSHGRGSHEDQISLEGYRTNWAGFLENCAVFKKYEAGWFLHVYSDEQEGVSVFASLWERALTETAGIRIAGLEYDFKDCGIQARTVLKLRGVEAFLGGRWSIRVGSLPARFEDADSRLFQQRNRGVEQRVWRARRRCSMLLGGSGRKWGSVYVTLGRPTDLHHYSTLAFTKQAERTAPGECGGPHQPRG